MPFPLPNQKCQNTQRKISYCMDLLTPSSSRVFQLCLRPLIASGYLAKDCHTCDQLSDASSPNNDLLPARRRPQGLVVFGVCLSVCLSVSLCALFLSARYLKNGFMDHNQICWVRAGSEPLEQVQFRCWSDSGCVSKITFTFPLTLLQDWAFWHA